MATFERFSPPRRVEILHSKGRHFKPGQFGYVEAVQYSGGMYFQDKDGSSAPGEPAYLVTKSKHGRGGALWFSKDGVRFTSGSRGTKRKSAGRSRSGHGSAAYRNTMAWLDVIAADLAGKPIRFSHPGVSKSSVLLKKRKSLTRLRPTRSATRKRGYGVVRAGRFVPPSKIIPITSHPKAKPVCPNCQQWQYPTRAGYVDCSNECARRGFAPKRSTRR